MSLLRLFLCLGKLRWKQSRRGFAFAVLLTGLMGVEGCGGGSPAAIAPTPVTPSNLNGNWLIAGSLPSESLDPVANLNLAITFDVNGDGVCQCTVRECWDFGGIWRAGVWNGCGGRKLYGADAVCGWVTTSVSGCDPGHGSEAEWRCVEWKLHGGE